MSVGGDEGGGVGGFKEGTRDNRGFGEAGGGERDGFVTNEVRCEEIKRE